MRSILFAASILLAATGTAHAGALAADENIQIIMTVDKIKAAIDEPIAVTFDLATRYDTRYEGFEIQPRFDGFYIEREAVDDSPKTEEIRLKKKKYIKATVQKFTIYPIQAGELKIEPGTVKTSIRVKGINLKNVTDGKRKDVFLTTEPVIVKVANREEPSKYLETLPAPAVEGEGQPQIILLMDVSGTMRTLDFEDSRLAATKKIADSFLKSKPQASIGIKAFAEEVKTVMPLAPLPESLPDIALITPDMISDGSAVGDAIYEAVKEVMLKQGARSIVMLTDGTPSNAGNFEPLTAARFAKERDVKVHVISIGKTGMLPFPVIDPETGAFQIIKADIKKDPETFKKIAAATGGLYREAADEARLKKAFGEVRETLGV